MKILLWLLVLAALGVLGYVLWVWRQRWAEHKRTSEERIASFMAQAGPAAPPPAAAEKPIDPQQRLLLEAGAKAAEAGEPALAIQLYARLLARYPESPFGTQAHSAIETQKQKLAKA